MTEQLILTYAERKAKDPEKFLEARKRAAAAYRLKNPEAAKAVCRKYYAKDPKRWISYSRAYAARHPEKIKAQRTAMRDHKSALIRTAKNVPCADCKQRYPYYVMDLDHVRGAKVAAVSAMTTSSFSAERLLSEIVKCDAVCANCHRERTFARRRHQGIRNP